MAELMLVLVLGLAGPLLAAPRRFAIPVAVGEILAGVVFGLSGFKVIDPAQSNLALMTQIGFALMMMVTGSHIDVRKIFNERVALVAVRNVAVSAVAGLAVSYLICDFTQDFQNLGTFAVILSSSSAAVILPILGGKKASSAYASIITQVTLADLLAIVLVPVVTQSQNSNRVFLGAVVITLAASAIYLLLRWAQSSGIWKRTRKFSAQNGFGLELRLSLILLLGLIWLAQSFTVTIMMAGFGLGLAIAANGMPRRLAKQVFAVSEGLFSPVFFVLLGAGIDVSAVFRRADLFGLALMLGFGAIVVHLVPVLLGLKPSLGVISSAQLGVPAAVVSIGVANHTLTSGQSAAIMLGALITLAATAVAAAAKVKAV